MLLSNSVCRKRWKGLQPETHCRKNWRQRKEERKTQAELERQQARQHNTTAKQMESIPAGVHTGYTTTTGAGGTTAGHKTETHHMSAMPGHGTGQGQLGQVTHKSGHRNKGAFTDSRSVSIN